MSEQGAAGGGDSNSGLILIVAGIAAIVMLFMAVFGTATLFTGFIPSTTTGQRSGGFTQADCLAKSLGSKANPEQDEVARDIYATAIESGLGENAALMGIYVAYAESTLSNKTVGDGSKGNTSRGAFQQLAPWAKSKAWSGQKWPKGMDADYFDGTNAWGPNGWAEGDPRMNVVSSAKMFMNSLRDRVRNPSAGRAATEGVSLADLTIPLKEWKEKELTDEEMILWSHQVQGWDWVGSYANNAGKVDKAREIFERIRAEGVTMPQSQLAQAGLTGNGLIMIGDSIMEGTKKNAPGPTQFGGPVSYFTEIGIGPRRAVDALKGTKKTPNGADWSAAFKNNDVSRVYVSLGTNSPGSPEKFADDIDAIMEMAGPNRTVYWNTLAYKPVQKYNKTLLVKSKEYNNLKLVDAEELFNQNPDLIEPDGIHPTYDGYEALWDAARSGMQGFTGNILVSGFQDPCMSILDQSLATAQTAVGPDGCPLDNPANTLRYGAEKIGVNRLCQQAVAQAPTPQAAAAIKWALSHLGIDYACAEKGSDGVSRYPRVFNNVNYTTQGAARQGPNAFDCSSFVAQAYYETTGIPIRAHSTLNMNRNADDNYKSLGLNGRMAGDLIVTRSSGSASGRHVVMYLGKIAGREWMVHTNACGDVSKVERFSAPTAERYLNTARPIAATAGQQRTILKRLGLDQRAPISATAAEKTNTTTPASTVAAEKAVNE